MTNIWMFMIKLTMAIAALLLVVGIFTGNLLVICANAFNLALCYWLLSDKDSPLDWGNDEEI